MPLDPKEFDRIKDMDQRELMAYARSVQELADAQGAVGNASLAVVAEWDRHPECKTVGDLEQAAFADRALAEALATERKAWRKIALLEENMVANGWWTEDERTVTIGPDGTIVRMMAG